MRFIVCIKQVPDTREVKINPKTGTLIREGVPTIINPEDKNALEAAFQLREKNGGEVVVITMGPPAAKEALIEAVSMGADRAILIGDVKFAGADTAATSYTLGEAVRKVGDFDMILCGHEAIDGNTAQVGPQLAELLGIPQATYADRIDIEDSKVCVRRKLENGYEVIRTGLPVLVTVVKDYGAPRIPAVPSILAAYENEDAIVHWGAEDICQNGYEHYGLKGSPTRIFKSGSAEYKKKEVAMLQGSMQEVAAQIADVFSSERLI